MRFWIIKYAIILAGLFALPLLVIIPRESVGLADHDASTPAPLENSVVLKDTGAYPSSIPELDALPPPVSMHPIKPDITPPSVWRNLQPDEIIHVQVSGMEILAGVISRTWTSDEVYQLNATFSHPANGVMGMKWQEGRVLGTIQFPDINTAYVISADDQFAQIDVRRMALSELICAKPRVGVSPPDIGSPVLAGMPRPTNEVFVAFASSAPPMPASIPVLRSRPASGNVIYLDFDGETVTDSAWNGGNTIFAAPARFNDSQIQEVWRRVVADFEVFDVNVTTLASDYTNATPGRRTHVIITPTDTAAPGAGGVAYIGSFAGLYSRYCWAFIDTEAKACAEVVSHEVGHTLGLFHDGRTSPLEEYYAGHGSGVTGWAPIMGVGYYRELTQWSKGEYPAANNTQDDLQIMSTLIPYLADDHGNNTNTATSIIGSSMDGRIGSSSDVDVFVVSLTSGLHTIYLQPVIHGNIDGLLEVLNSSGSIIATSNPPNLLSAAATFNLASPQNVYLRVRGVGKPAGADPGYTAYGSLGTYTLYGFGDQQQPPSAPIGLSIKRISGSQLQVSWQSTISATNYLVYRDNTYIGYTTNLIFKDAGLFSSTLYSYTLRAENAYGLSPYSELTAISTPAANEFIMDGEADFATYLLSSPGMVIYAAVRGTRLYVSTWSPGSDGAGFGSDHHLFVSDVLLPSATTPAPWAKQGFIAVPGNKPYLAGESTTTYAGWFNTVGPVTLFKPPVNSLQMEGSIDLVAEFGNMPEYVYLAAVAYNTEDANMNFPTWGQINAQAPAAVIANNNLEPQEFLQVPIAAIRDTAMDGVYDVLSPDHAFRVDVFGVSVNNHFTFEWMSAPGGRFIIKRAADVNQVDWQTIGGRTNTMEQWGQTFTDTNPPASGAYYRLERH
ncbi:MAG TPA: hypothetical protein PJ991_05340 [Kiritimatiellia bacterium]|nr:hypothetical protein [Kiritimatiellia bacterium]